MSILSICPNNLCVELLTVSNSSLCPTPHCVQLIIVSNLSCCVFYLSEDLICHCDLLAIGCSFFKTRSKSTFLCVSSKKNKKIIIFVFFDLVCSFCRISLTKCPPTKNKKRTKRSCRQEIRKMSFAFLLLDPPYRLQLVTHRVFVS